MASHVHRLAAGGIAALAIAAFAASGPARADEHGPWIGTWGASPSAAAVTQIANMTFRHVVRISIGGSSLRIRLSNELSTQAVTIGDAHVAVSAGGVAIRGGTDHTLTFDGLPSITIPAGGSVLSDPTNFNVPALTSLAVSIYLPEGGNLITEHSLGTQTAFQMLGDMTAAVSPTGATPFQKRFYLSGVEVSNPNDAVSGALVTLGDSITDGFRSTVDADHRWPDFLAARLAAAGGAVSRIGVVNEGISGNFALISPAVQNSARPSTRARFDRDVLTTQNVSLLTLMIGINDIDKSPTAGLANALIAAHHQLIARAHARGILAYGCTLTPHSTITDDREAVRQAVNAWIRTSGEYDAVIDFDKVTRDPANPRQFLPAFNSGDQLHPNDAGYQAMANSIDLKLFMPNNGHQIAFTP
jgi:lysophospholipase L1-like esterase